MPRTDSATPERARNGHRTRLACGAAAAAIVGVVVLAACNHDGRILRPARPDQNVSISTVAAATTTSTPSFADQLDPSSASSASGASSPSSEDVGDGSDGGSSASAESDEAAGAATAPWRDGAAIDDRYTCAGANISPALSWPAAPSGTGEVAIVMTDAQKPGFVHWAVAGLDPAVTSVVEGAVPEGAIQAVNGSGGTGYSGPCPPAGSTHTYLISVRYLGEQIELGDGADSRDLILAIDAATLRRADVTGTFTRT